MIGCVIFIIFKDIYWLNDIKIEIKKKKNSSYIIVF